jgi:23S rRNA (uridine2552-2'-O)-methyltransferase
MPSSYEKPDFWSLKAQQEGYPARSVYKLKEIDEKTGLFRRAGGGAPRVLDLGAAPGSWSLYVLRKFPAPTAESAGRILLAAADLAPLSRHCDKGLFSRKDFFFLQGDFTAEETRNALLGRGPYTTLLSDAAPATTGSRAVDTARSFALAEAALAFADAALETGGNLAVKVFQGGETAELLARLRAGFQQARSFKPKACRSGSVETYLLGLGKR